MIFIECVLRGLYLLLIAYFLSITFLATVLILFRLKYVVERRNEPEIKSILLETFRSDGAFSEKLKRFLETSVVANIYLAVLSIILCFVIISVVPWLSQNWILAAAVTVMILPYIWGFTRATSIGGHCGATGTMLGLAYLAIVHPQISWWDSAPLFLGINSVAGISGWLGGFIGLGQIKESVILQQLTVDLSKRSSALIVLMDRVKGNVDTRLREEGTVKLSFSTSNPQTQLVQSHSNKRDFSISAFEYNQIWRLGYRPTREVLGWLSRESRGSHSTNQIADKAFNAWRHTVVEVRFSTSEKNGSHIDCETMDITMLTYKATPSIIWVDDEVDDLASDLAAILIQTVNEVDEGQDAVPFSEVLDSSRVICRNWQGSVKLEQYSKETKGTIGPLEYLKGGLIDKRIGFSPEILDSIFSSPTYFAKIRGRTSTFILFLVGQVGFALFLNWFYEILTR